MSLSHNFTAKTGHSLKKATEKKNATIETIERIEQIKSQNLDQNMTGKDIEELALQSITKQKLVKSVNEDSIENQNKSKYAEQNSVLESYRFQKILLALTAQLVDISDQFRASFIVLGKNPTLYWPNRSRRDSVHSVISADYHRPHFREFRLFLAPLADNGQDSARGRQS